MLSEQEAAEVLAYARQYPEVQQAIDSYEASLEQYARLHAVQPPAALQEKSGTGYRLVPDRPP